MAVGSVPSALLGVWVIEILQREYGEDRLEELVLGMLGGALLVVGFATLLRTLFFKDVIQERSAMHLYRRHIIAAIITGVTCGLRHRPHLRRQRHPDRNRPDRDLPPHAAAGCRYRRLPRRRPAVGGGRCSLDRRQHRLRARREHPARVRPGRDHRDQAVGQGAAGIPPRRARRRPDRVRHRPSCSSKARRRRPGADRRRRDDRALGGLQLIQRSRSTPALPQSD